MDFAAWMEVWLGDRWWTFDPRNNARRKGRVLIGRGRDASDVAMATTFGAPRLDAACPGSANRVRPRGGEASAPGSPAGRFRGRASPDAAPRRRRHPAWG